MVNQIIKSAANIVDKQPVEKQPTIPGWAIEHLQSGNIRQMSKGIITYECLMMAYDNYADSFSELEQKEVDGVSVDIFGLLDDIVLAQVGEAKTTLQDDSEYPDGYTDTTSIQVPCYVADELPGYESGYHIADAIAYTFASPWESRHDRLSDVQDLVRLSNGDSVDSPSVFVQSVIDNDSYKYDVQSLHEAIDDSIEIWQMSDFDVDQLKKVGGDITTTDRGAALDAAISNEDGFYTDAELQDIAREAFDCVDKSARKYAGKVNSQDGIKIDLREKVSQIAEKADPHSTLTTSEWKLAGLSNNMPSEQAEKLSKVYTDPGILIEVIIELEKNMMSNPDNKPKQVTKGYNLMMDWLESLENQAPQLAD